MKRFAFGLEKVLKFKQRREWLAQIRQQQKAAAVQAAQAVEDGLHYQMNETCLRLQEKLGQAQDATMWMAVYSQSVRLEQALQSARRQVEAAATELDKAAAQRKQAAVEVEMLLSLRQRQWQEYRTLTQRAAQAQLDDMGMQRWLAAQAKQDSSEGART